MKKSFNSPQECYLCRHMAQAFIRKEFFLRFGAFTLVEMLMALLIVSVILSASLPVISQRQKSLSAAYSKYSPMPIGAIIMWKVDGALPDSTWLEANGQALPSGIEYEQCRKVYGSRLPDLRGADSEFYTNLNSYLSKDIKDYLQSAIKPIPQNLIGIWGTNAAIPDGWSEATEYRGVFLRGYGTIAHTQNNGTTIGNTATTHSSAEIGTVQGDAIRNITGGHYSYDYASDTNFANGAFSMGHAASNLQSGGSGRLDREYWVNFNSAAVSPVSNEIRPVNKSVRYIKYTNSASLPQMPEAPKYTQKFRYIVKVRN